MSESDISSFEQFNEGFPEIQPDICEKLIEYLRSQFEAAYREEAYDSEQDTVFDNGTFYTQMHVAQDGHHQLEELSIRVILAPPLNVSRVEQPREYVEVFAIFLRGEDGHMVGDASGYFADQYLVRQFSDGHTHPYQLVTDDGVFLADLDEFDAVAGFGSLAQPPLTLDEELTQISAPLLAAQQLYTVISRCNIVAATD